MKIENIIKDFKTEAEKLYADRLKKIILYGSHATGKATDDSDIDLAVILAEDVVVGRVIDQLIDAITEINLKYNVLLSIYPVSEKDYNTLNSPLLLNMRKQGVAV